MCVVCYALAVAPCLVIPCEAEKLDSPGSSVADSPDHRGLSKILDAIREQKVGNPAGPHGMVLCVDVFLGNSWLVNGLAIGD